MENEEYLRIVNEAGSEIGVASRSEVHRLGYWHETFHCWFVTTHKGTDYLFLQLRSETKEHYPDLFDITAAGHITADETVDDGVREVKEETGIDVAFSELEPLGLLKYAVVQGDLIDNELAHTFLFRSPHHLQDFHVDPTEVAGMVQVAYADFRKLWLGESEAIQVEGFKLESNGVKTHFTEYAGRERFVPHQLSFYQEIIKKIDNQLRK